MDSAQEAVSRRLGQSLRDKWTLERLLGAGGMAAVYEARHRNGARAAVKLLHPEMSQREDVRERFRREGYAANKVAHRGAVRVLDDDVAEDGSAFLVMELLEGESLAARANRQGGVDVGELLGWMDEILDVLAAAHAQGIVHRDLKPDNIFLTLDGRVKLLDFGIARFLDSVPSSFKTKMGTALGTAPYMAPEQALGKLHDVDGRSDLFSVGATMFRLIARRKIHEAPSDAEILAAMATKAAPLLASVAPGAPPHVCTLVDRSLAYLPERRYPDAPTMQRDLRAVQGGSPPPHATAQLVAGIDPSFTKPQRTEGLATAKTIAQPASRPLPPSLGAGIAAPSKRPEPTQVAPASARIDPARGAASGPVETPSPGALPSPPVHPDLTSPEAPTVAIGPPLVSGAASGTPGWSPTAQTSPAVTVVSADGTNAARRRWAIAGLGVVGIALAGTMLWMSRQRADAPAGGTTSSPASSENAAPALAPTASADPPPTESVATAAPLRPALEPRAPEPNRVIPPRAPPTPTGQASKVAPIAAPTPAAPAGIKKSQGGKKKGRQQR
jgi:serine/threonine protein kinase